MVLRGPDLRGTRMRPVVEQPVRAEVVPLVAVGGLPEVRRLVRGLLGLAVCWASYPVRAR